MPIALDALFRETVASLDSEQQVVAELAHSGGPLLAAPEVLVLALGKPALAMARGAAKALPRARGLIVSPRAGVAPPGFEVLLGEHPLPDAGSLQAGVALLERAAEARTAVLFLISGGGSSLACVPVDRVSLLEKQAATKALLMAGAPIEEVNVVRKHLSRLKGGRLAAACRATVRTVLLVSDVVAGEVHSVASGPTVADPSRFGDALDVLQRYQVAVPPSVADHLQRGARGLTPETPKPGDPALADVDVRILAQVNDLSATAARLASQGGWAAQVLDPMVADVETEAGRLARRFTQFPVGSLLIAGGEPTVRPRPGGEGGRAQHLALLLGRELRGQPVEILVAGSDGHDFKSGASGAIVDGTTWNRAEAMGFAPDRRVAGFDSGVLCAQLGAQLPNFASGTNLGDLVLIARQD